MSAFMVEDKTINQVVWFLAYGRDADYLRRMVKQELGVDLETPEGQAALGEAMFKLNQRGVEERYGENSASDFRPMDYRYRAEPTTPIQALKSLQCWHYQCCEGSVPDESLLYATMDRLSGELAMQIVSKLPEWDKAGWG